MRVTTGFWADFLKPIYHVDSNPLVNNPCPEAGLAQSSRGQKAGEL
jgi:hypothetical protein